LIPAHLPEKRQARSRLLPRNTWTDTSIEELEERWADNVEISWLEFLSEPSLHYGQFLTKPRNRMILASPEFG